jgi:Mrp family chromosome partitioning ATPase
VVVSPAQGEGKGAATCAALGKTLAKAGKRILILDCDFRRGSGHKFFGMDDSRGIVDVLAGAPRLQEVWKEPVRGLKVVSKATAVVTRILSVDRAASPVVSSECWFGRPNG